MHTAIHRWLRPAARLVLLAGLLAPMAAPTTAQGADAQPRRSTVTTGDGVRLSVQEFGDPAAPAIVFVHGIAQSQLAFSRQTTGALASRYRLITYDLRGHGESDKPLDAAAYTSGRRMSEDLQAVIEATKANRPVLVGWSLGGIIVAQYLRDFGTSHVAGVNFVGARIAQPPGTPQRMAGAAYIRQMLSEDLAVNIRATANFVRHCVAAPLAPEDFERMFGYNMATPLHARAATLKWSGGTYFADALKRLDVPVLITHGRKDQVISPEVATEAGRLVPGAQVSLYDEAGHSPFFEDAARFDRELAAFVDASRTKR